MESLLNVLHEDGCSLIAGIGCTYSVDESTFSQLPDAFGIALNRGERIKFEKGELFRLYAQFGKAPFAHNAIRTVNPGSGVLHAKVYCLKYKKNSEPNKFIYKLIAASANLTDSDELNAYVSFKGNKAENNDPFGESVRRFFMGLDKGLETDIAFSSLINEISKVHFDTDDSTEFIAVDGSVSDRIKKETVETVISPFISKEVIKQLDPNILISRADQLDQLYKEELLSGKILLKILCNDDADGEDAIHTSSLHAKVYVTQKHIYIGSANATNSAFGGNLEVLVCFDRKNDAGAFLKNIDQWTTEYAPCTPDNALKERRDFESKCRGIISKFSYDSDLYSFEPWPEGYKIYFENNELKNNSINRTDKQLHTVSVKIEKGEFSSEYILLISGELLAVDEQKLNKEYTSAVVAAVFGSAQGERSQPANRRKAAGRQSAVKASAGESIVSKLRNIRTPDELLKCRKNISDLQNTDDKLNGILMKFMADTEKLAAEVQQWTK